ncbi:hypothetical protein [Rheinheimera nanhaiensis]|uniref:hypothetical protein n=1 Tax=Rheinheimera nanhaiensis TaxID=1163621 RepID=UPI00058DF32E|nr:hypothetical protein [Rheinheimera nanhaiensis]
MKDVLEFLENIGANSTLNRVNDVAYKSFVKSMSFNADIENAIVSRDFKTLESVVGSTGEFVCAICVPGEEPSDLKVAA